MTYEDILELIEDTGFTVDDLPLTSVNDDGENIVVDREDTEDGQIVLKLSTAQSNGWMRVNYFWPDGTTEEMYEK